MNIWLVIIAIAVISVILAAVSLEGLEDRSHIGRMKKKLFKGRVIFQDSSSGK